MQVKPGFIIGLRGVMRWPVRAFAVEYNGLGYIETVYWIDGQSIGVYKFESETDISTVIRPLAAVSALLVLSKVEVEGFNRGRLHRLLTIEFGPDGEDATGEDISVSSTDDIEHVADLNKRFIEAVLNASAGKAE